MPLMYLHFRPAYREDQPLDHMDFDEDDYLMAAEVDRAALITPPDSGTLDDTIMDAYQRLEMA